MLPGSVNRAGTGYDEHTQPGSMRRILFLTVAFATLAVPGPRGAQEPACEFDGVERVVAVGDVHGAHDQFLEILQAAGIIDRREPLGRRQDALRPDRRRRGSRRPTRARRSICSRSSNAKPRAPAGACTRSSATTKRCGSWPTMRYVAPGEYQAFVDGGSADVRRAFIEQSPQEQRAQLEKELVPGMIEMIRAFGPKGEYGTRIRALERRRANQRRGIPARRDQPGGRRRCRARAINETVRRELSVDLEKTRGATQREPDGARRRTALVPRPGPGARHVRAAGRPRFWRRRRRARSSSRTPFRRPAGSRPVRRQDLHDRHRHAAGVRAERPRVGARDPRATCSPPSTGTVAKSSAEASAVGASMTSLKGRGMRPSFTLPDRRAARRLRIRGRAARRSAIAGARRRRPTFRPSPIPGPTPRRSRNAASPRENRRLFAGHRSAADHDHGRLPSRAARPRSEEPEDLPRERHHPDGRRAGP